MILNIYFDVYPWTTQENIYFQNIPADKPSNAKRYRVDIEIADPKDPDEVFEAEAKEIKNET